MLTNCTKRVSCLLLTFSDVFVEIQLSDFKLVSFRLSLYRFDDWVSVLIIEEPQELLQCFCFVSIVSRNEEQLEEAGRSSLLFFIILIAWQKDRGEADTCQQEPGQTAKPRTIKQLLSSKRCF